MAKISAPSMGSGDEFWHRDEVEATRDFEVREYRVSKLALFLGFRSLKDTVFSVSIPEYPAPLPGVDFDPSLN